MSIRQPCAQPPHPAAPAPSSLPPQVRRTEQALFEELGATPSPHAVAQRSGIPYPKLMALYKVG